MIEPVEECRLILGGASFLGKQGLDCFSGLSAESVGARVISARTDPNEQESVVLLDESETA